MTLTLKKNRELLEFTFILVTITIIGPIVLYFVKNDYAKAYKAWFKASRAKILELYDELTPEQKEMLQHRLTWAKTETTDYIKAKLVEAGVNEETADSIVNIGSKAIKKALKKI